MSLHYKTRAGPEFMARACPWGPRDVARRSADAVRLHHVVVLVLQDVAVEDIGPGEPLDGRGLGVTGEGRRDTGCGASEGDEDPGDLAGWGEHGVLPAPLAGRGRRGLAEEEPVGGLRRPRTHSRHRR